MEQYIQQLINDLREAHTLVPAELTEDNFDENLFEGVEAFLHGPQYSMEQLTGIKPEAFPPKERLSEAQAKRLCDEIESLWFAFNIVADFPEKIPPTLIYGALRQKWKEELFPQLKQGHVHTEFCDYDSSNCLWPQEYCWCKGKF